VLCKRGKDGGGGGGEGQGAGRQARTNVYLSIKPRTVLTHTCLSQSTGKTVKNKGLKYTKMFIELSERWAGKLKF